MKDCKQAKSVRYLPKFCEGNGRFLFSASPLQWGFRHQKNVLAAHLKDLQHTMQMVEYKCWYYEVAKVACTIEAPRNRTLSEVSERFRKIHQELKSASEE